MSPRPYIGGQAVLEGVMMRAPKSFAVVLRRRDGTLEVREQAMKPPGKGVLGWPLVRGVASLVESLRLGNAALRFSVEAMEKDMASGAPPGPVPRGVAMLRATCLTLLALMAEPDGRGAPIEAAGSTRGAGKGGGGWLMLAFAVAFLVALPQAVAAGIDRLFHLGLAVQSAPFQAITGALKLCVVLGYLLAIRRVPEIRRVFQYHGAEHKTISTYEDGAPLTVAEARARTTMHPRCGTTFLVMVAIVSVIAFTALGAALPRITTGSAILDQVLFFFEKLPCLPIIVAVTFELQRLLARYCSTGPLRALLWPGFLVQKITTAEPDDAQLEVALASLRCTLFRQEMGHDYATSEDVRFPSYEGLLAAASLRTRYATV